jgi:LuxR family maltose regulon positive regulatory protein
MAALLQSAAAQQVLPVYTAKLLAAFGATADDRADPLRATTPVLSVARQPLIEPLSAREVEILELIAQGFSNREIGERLYIALDTVKGHNRKIFGKLGVQRRTEAIARARAVGLL